MPRPVKGRLVLRCGAIATYSGSELRSLHVPERVPLVDVLAELALRDPDAAAELTRGGCLVFPASMLAPVVREGETPPGQAPLGDDGGRLHAPIGGAS